MNFKNYFNKYWKPYFINGELDYAYLTKNQRSNSYIENYNKRIKLQLANYFDGRSISIVEWPIFLKFIKDEEEYYEAKATILKRRLPEKNLQNEKKKKLQFEENVLPIGVKNKITRAWLKNKKLSCRYDCFFLLYTFIMIPIL